MLSYSRGQPKEPIAIIGTGLRFPGNSNTPEKLWDLLRNPRDVQSVVPSNRFNMDGFYDSDGRQSTSQTRHGYFLNEDHRHFDADFFGIKPIEANAMDPQQRMLLEVVYEGIEAAGMSIEALRGSPTAVYVGLMSGDYSDMLNRDPTDFPPYLAAGTARSIMSNRVSYVFDWRGPSMTIDTACSSSLVAVHHAVQALRLGDCDIAVAAGANLILGPEQYIAGSSMKMMSPDGRSYMWDSRANGYARGEGIAAVVLKTLSVAMADGDHIECIIRETGLNQDGRTSGLTVPSAAAQTALIEATYRKAGLDLAKPSDRPQYFEAHGTGTPAGDPVEAQAIHDAFFGTKIKDSELAGEPLYCGSVKTIIGHTEGTAGLAGLIKASLALQDGIIPPNHLFRDLAPNIKPFYKNLKIATEARAWPALEPGSVRRASVNSFGFGGTNAHCILESHSPIKPNHVEHDTLHLPFVFSAASEKSLVSLLSSYSRYLKTQPSIDLGALSHTLCCRRTALPVRAAFTAEDVEELFVKIDAYVQDPSVKPKVTASISATAPRILGIFTGQGAQWAGMARKFMQIPAAVRIIDDLESSLAELPDPPIWSLKVEMSKDASCSRVTEAAIAQPVCTATQILLVEMLRAAGVRFSTVVGHSSGEIAAAFAADRLSARDAIRISYYRGVHLPLVGGSNGEAGAMVAVGASYEEARSICDSDRFRGKLCVGASNSGASVTLSGDIKAVQDVTEMFTTQKRFARRLRVDNAYHSHHMLRCSEAITASVRACNVTFKQPSSSGCLWVSSVDMKPITNDADISDYWHRNTIGCVFFSQALQNALKLNDFDLAVEVGAHPALKGPALQVIESVLGRTIPYTGVLSRNVNDVKAFSEGVAYLWTGFRHPIVSFAGYYQFLGSPGRTQQPANLPSYPWDHKRSYWYESRKSQMYRHQSTQHELLGMQTSYYSSDQIVWKKYFIPKDIPWILGHCIQGQLVFPGSAYIVAAFETVREAATGQSIKSIELLDLTFGQSLVFQSEDTRVEVLITLSGMQRRRSTLTAKFTYHSIGSHDLGPMSLNATCQVRVAFGQANEPLYPPVEEHYGMIDVDEERIYESLASCGYQYSGAFKALHSVKRKMDVAFGMIHAAATNSLIHPATLDAAIHSIAVAHSYPGDGRLTSALLPVGLSKICLDFGQAMACSNDRNLKFTSFSVDDGGGDVDIYPADGSNAVLRLQGLRTKPMVPATPANDIHMFSETVWGPASPVLATAPDNLMFTGSEVERDVQAMTSIASQISHRYPALNILSISARVIDAVTVFLKGLNGAFASFTYTDVSPEYLEEAKMSLQSFEDKMVYKTWDMNCELAKQELVEHSFDLVVALSHSTDNSNLDRTVKTIRRLLKPGGYFLCPRVVDFQRLIAGGPFEPVVLETVPSCCDGPPCSPDDTVSRAQTLDDYGFAEIEWLATSECAKVSSSSVMLLQAVDDRVRLLREPQSSVDPAMRFSDVTVIGGTLSRTSSCVRSIADSLEGFSDGVTNVTSLAGFTDDNMSFGSSVVVLQDHDKHLFEDLNEATFKGLQRLLKRSRNILWVTHGYKDNLPPARMLVGFARCLIQEMPHIRLQIMDFPSSQPLDARIISKSLIRLLLTAKFEDEARLSDMLWSVEPEISYLDGHEYIPRMKLDDSRNIRYNSAHRDITQTVSPNMSYVTVSVEDGTFELRAKAEPDRKLSEDVADTVSIRVTHSSLKAIKVLNSGYYYIILGNDVVNQEQFIALSSTLSSVVDVPRTLARPCLMSREAAINHLYGFIHGLFSSTALRDLTSGQHLVVLEPSESYAGVLTHFAAEQDVQVIFVVANNPKCANSGACTWKQVPSRILNSGTKSPFLKAPPSRVLAWKESDWTSEVRHNLPDCVPIESSGSYFATTASAAHGINTSKLSAALDLVQAKLATMGASVTAPGPEVIPISNLSGTSTAVEGTTMIDWSSTQPVPIRVETADQRVRFRRDRTYWLVGLTGDLGTSLSEWMIARDAKHIVLSSRNPSIDTRWLAHCEALGATVKVYPCDVTDSESVQAVYETIRKELPPIGGVCHGAMVLRDALVQDLEISHVEQVLKPKVDGAINLDQVLRGDDLDFFIMLSSIAAVTGNPGQAAYAAGNGFLAALTAQRRSRGHAASCIALGAILGGGYATRGLTLSQQKLLEKAGVMWTSQQDFHSAFAEAVLASPPQSGLTGEFGSGVPVTYTDLEYKPKHADNPIFSHLLLQRTSNSEIPSEIPSMSTKAQLMAATTSEEVFQILEDFLTPRLKKALQLTADANVIDQTAEGLGIDSLIAVDMRSWMIRELNIDMPILVVIGGNTMRAVLAHCVKLLDASMTPLLGPQIESAVTRPSKTSASAGVQQGPSKHSRNATAPHTISQVVSRQSSAIREANSPNSGDLQPETSCGEVAIVQIPSENTSPHTTLPLSLPQSTAIYEASKAPLPVVTAVSRDSTQCSSTQSHITEENAAAISATQMSAKRSRMWRIRKAVLRRFLSS